MKPLRWLAGGVLWILAGLLGLVGVLLSITVILLPLGIPIILLSRRLFSLSAKLVLPRAVRQPGREAGEAVKRGGNDVRKTVTRWKKGLGRKSRKMLDKAGARRSGVLGRVGLRR